MAKIIEIGLVKADSPMLQSGFTTRFMIKSKKSTKGSPKSTTGEIQAASKPTEKTDDKLEIFPILPLRNTVLFPQQIIPIYVGREQSLKLIADLPKGGKKYIVVVAQKDGSLENPKAKDLYKYGTLAMVMKVFDMPYKSRSAIVQGLERVYVKEFMNPDPYYKGLVQKVRAQLHRLQN